MENSISTFYLKKMSLRKTNLTPIEGGKVLVNDAKIAENFNSFFGKMANTLNIEKDESIFCDTGGETDPLLHAIRKIYQTS